MMHVLLFLLCVATSTSIVARYDPTWDSLDKRPLPTWFDQDKIGIFVHFGVFSVPSFRSEWFWYYWQGTKEKDVVDFMKKNYRPDFTYGDFAPSFTAEFFDPSAWAELFEAAGARYVVLTSKHHEGFCNWDTTRSFNWNSLDVGPNRNIVKELAEAIRNKTKVKFGLYHSLYEWFNPLYLNDASSNFTSQKFVDSKTLPELYDLVNKFKPEVIWSDGDWTASDAYWRSRDFLAWLYNDSPVKDTVVTNDRWGAGCMCKHGGYYTCSDRYNPGHLVRHKWENCLSLDSKSWGFRREASLLDYLTIEEVLEQVASSVSCGGNVLINVGPRKDGMIDAVQEERLRQLGAWLKVNGEAIYSSSPWTHQNDTKTKKIWYTKQNSTGAVYAILLDMPANGTVLLGAPKLLPTTSVSLLGFNGTLKANSTSSGVVVEIPDAALASLRWAWTLKFSALNETLASANTDQEGSGELELQIQEVFVYQSRGEAPVVSVGKWPPFP